MYDEDECPDCGEPFDDCQCFPDPEDVPEIVNAPASRELPFIDFGEMPF